MKTFLLRLTLPVISRLRISFALIFIATFFSADVDAANYFWVGGSGNWSNLSHWATTSGGTTFHSQIPTALDDVFFDANSFTAAGQTVNLDPLTILTHDMNWTGVTNNPTLAGSPGALLKIYGSLKFVAGMNMNFAGDISFESTSPGKTILMAGRSFLKSAAFNGIGGGWMLQDAFTTTGAVTLNNGGLNTNSQTVTASSFASPASVPVPRTLDMGASTFNLSGGQFWSVSSVGFGLTVNAGTSVINSTAPASTVQFNAGTGQNYYDVNFSGTGIGAKGVISGSANNFHDVIFSAAGEISAGCTFRNVNIARDGELKGNNTFSNLSFTAGYTYILKAGFTQTVSGIFSVNGNCGAFVDIHSDNAGAAAFISHPSGAVNISFAILKDIQATGGGTFIAANSIDLGNNTGWTINFPAPKNLYWIGNTGNWEDGNHWSLTSGGAPSGCSPSPTDNVFFDANSFTAAGQSVNINIPTAYCRDMNWTGVTNLPSLSGASSVLLKIYGSLAFAGGMNLNFTGFTNFEATVTGKTIRMNTKTFKNDVAFNGTGGGWDLLDAFSATATVLLNSGTASTNNNPVTAVTFLANPVPPRARTLNMGSSVFTLNGSGTAWLATSSLFTLNSGTSVINCTGASPGFNGGGLLYYDLNFTNPLSSGQLDDNNTFHDAVFSSTVRILKSNIFRNATFLGAANIDKVNVYTNLTFTAPYTYSLGTGSVQSVSNNFNASGTCNSFLVINSQSPGIQASISHSAGTVSNAFLILKDIIATGGGTFNANQSIDLGNNTGWNFTSPAGRDLYWIGNTGNWNDGSHWSLTSGGAASGCSPSPMDNVFFDANSFSSVGRTVTITAPNAYCRNMTWTGVTNNPSFTGGSSIILNIYGSLTFSAAMSQSFLGNINFEATSAGQTITTATQSFKQNVNFRGRGGAWTLQDNLTAAGAINLYFGTLNSNNKTVNAGTFFSLPLPGVNNPPRILNMGSSVFNLSSSNAFWNVSSASAGLQINAGTSVINSLTVNTGAEFRGGGGHTYYDVNFTGTGSSAKGIIEDDNNSFHDVFFASAGAIYNPSVFHDVIVSGDGVIESTNTFNNLTFTAGYTYTLKSQTVQNIGNNWKIQGSCTLYVILQSSVSGSPAIIRKLSGSVLGYNIHIKDISSTGGANYIAYNSVDLGGNTGWAFSSLPPLLNPNLIIGPASVCPGANNVVYHIPPVQGAIAYQWTVPAGATIISGQGDTLIVVNFGTAVTGNISVQSFNGCNYGTLSSSLTLVTGSATAPLLRLSAFPAGAICPGTSVTFTAVSTPAAATGSVYQFRINNAVVQNGTSNVYSISNLSNGDKINCVLTTATATCGGASFVVPSDTVTMLVYPKPVISFNPAAPTIASGSSVQLNASVTGIVSSYLWTPSVGLNNTAVNNPSASPVTTTLYHLKVTSSNNCTADSSMTVTVINNCALLIPNAFTPNGDGINDKWVITKGNCIVELEVSVYNRYGSLVYHAEDYQSNWDGTYKSKPLPDGTYFYVAKTLKRGINYEVFKGDLTILR